jgi:hypothetical protein
MTAEQYRKSAWSEGTLFAGAFSFRPTYTYFRRLIRLELRLPVEHNNRKCMKDDIPSRSPFSSLFGGYYRFNSLTCSSTAASSFFSSSAYSSKSLARSSFVKNRLPLYP